ncbi:MAG: ABC transporter ATP-binding protein [Deltaproteobacteria bacterium]|nr:ABC transporter ATP-binding protein [Deltaproteobacteria bacterium]
MTHLPNHNHDPSIATIEVKNLVVHYGPRKILDGVSLRVFPAEILVVLGGSGCGKSTLLRTMLGLLRPTSGQVLIKSKDITRLNEDELLEIRLRTGVLFQSAALFNSMTIEENVSLPLREHTALNDATIKIMSRIKIGLVGLSGYEDFLPSQLSGGMKKRAGLARAISMDPEVLFFDEPSAGLDPITAAGLDDLILKLKKTFKMSIIVVTHELPSVFKIADRIVMMDKGLVIFDGTTEEIKASSIPRVRQFIEREPEGDACQTGQFLEALNCG